MTPDQSSVVYNPAREARNKKIKSAGRAAVIVFIFLIILAGILNYFNVINLVSLFPALNFLPRQERVYVQLPVVGQGMEINAVSQRSGYMLEIADKKKMTEYIKSLNIEGRTFNQGVQEDTKPLKRIHFILSDKPDQANTYRTEKGEELFAYTFGFEGDTASISIWLPEGTMAASNRYELFGSAAVHLLATLNRQNPMAPLANNEMTKALFKITEKVQ